MLILIDNERADAYLKPWGEWIMAARVRIKYRLEDLTGDRCLIVRYNQVTPALLEQLETTAVSSLVTVPTRTSTPVPKWPGCTQ